MVKNIIRIARALTFVTLLASSVGCALKKSATTVPPIYPNIVGNDEAGSLFKSDQAVLSNEDIQRILTARITIDDRRRLAVLALSPRISWSQELADLEVRNSERLLEALQASGRLTEVRLLPALLIPEKRTVPYLREAAARFQADLLLIYTTRTQAFQKDRFIGPDEVRARCVVESVLLDVRTGIVAHTTQRAETIEMKKSQRDLNFYETVAKAQTEAAGKALLNVADAVVGYLK